MADGGLPFLPRQAAHFRHLPLATLFYRPKLVCILTVSPPDNAVVFRKIIIQELSD
jgi:hypothetical protein